MFKYIEYMNIITNKNRNVNTTLKITFNSDISEDIGDILPYPNKHYINQVWVYYWLLDGFFGSKDSYEYLNDIKSRFLITYKDKINQIDTYPNKVIKEDYKHSLKHFQGLKSISINIINQTNRFDSSNDMVFWCLKIHAEYIIGIKGVITYQELLEYSIYHFKDHKKGVSTLKSKCRGIVNYYINNNYSLSRYVKKYNTKEEKEKLKMTRKQNMVKINKKKSEETQKKIDHFMSGMFIEEYKKPNGSWNKTLICKELGISRPTLDKYI